MNYYKTQIKALYTVAGSLLDSVNREKSVPTEVKSAVLRVEIALMKLVLSLESDHVLQRAVNAVESVTARTAQPMPAQADIDVVNDR